MTISDNYPVLCLRRKILVTMCTEMLRLGSASCMYSAATHAQCCDVCVLWSVMQDIMKSTSLLFLLVSPLLNTLTMSILNYAQCERAVGCLEASDDPQAVTVAINCQISNIYHLTGSCQRHTNHWWYSAKWETMCDDKQVQSPYFPPPQRSVPDCRRDGLWTSLDSMS